jgi:hypothetical protein
LSASGVPLGANVAASDCRVAPSLSEAAWVPRYAAVSEVVSEKRQRALRS